MDFLATKLNASEQQLAAETERRHRKAASDPDHLCLAFVQLCQRLKRPYSVAQIRAAAPPTIQGSTSGTIRLAAQRLGFKARSVSATPANLAVVPPPFLLIGRRAGEGWLVTSRVEDHLELQDPQGGGGAFHAIDTVEDLACEVLLFKPLAATSQKMDWRTPIMARLRPILWELGL
ncbi:MAG: cysteine peptidase family C39 domain-containing protein, partial [Geminicoccaceae bacterium]